jgi:multidrug efflux pump subunit AcrA (membrane-fusion protein)
VVCDGTTARVRKVAIGNRGDEGVEITEGLKAGEQVVIDHVLGLQNDQPITVAGQGHAAR